VSKICSKCEVEKQLDYFYKDKGGVFGVRSICKACDISKAKRWNSLNKEQHMQHQRKFRTTNPDQVRSIEKKYVKTNKAYSTKRRWHSLHDEYSKLKSREFRRNNPGYASFYSNLRKSRIKQATPCWLSKEQLHEMRDIYVQCSGLVKETGIKYNVDHVCPIVMKDENGVHVGCGLHVPWNLEIVTEEYNSKKGCSFYE
jgi:hypothetical protein